MFWASLLLGSWGSAIVMKWQVNICTRKFVSSPPAPSRGDSCDWWAPPRKAAGLGAEVKKKNLAKKDKTTSDAVFTFGYRVHFSSGKTVSLLWLYELKWTQQIYKTWSSWEENNTMTGTLRTEGFGKSRRLQRPKLSPQNVSGDWVNGRGKDCIMSDQPWRGKILRGPRNCKNYIYKIYLIELIQYDSEKLIQK